MRYHFAVTSLRADIAGHVPAHGVSVWWLGQSGLIVRGASGTVVVDPFVTDFGSFGRLYEPPLDPSELDFVDVLLGTHDHADHIDPLGFPAILAASPDAVGVVPAAALDRVTALDGVGVGRLRGARAGEPQQFGAIVLEPFPAVHAYEAADGYGFHLSADGDHPFLGYVIELDGVRIGHVGDTLIYPGLADYLRDAQLDLLLLPINGTSWFREQRGLVGNMNSVEAAELADLSGARLTMPVHWDLFADNTGDPAQFVRYAERLHPTVRPLVPEIGIRIDLTASARA
jgi:L-ascorbate metabolism protein UlaG (beta-lactamase superfamily)